MNTTKTYRSINMAATLMGIDRKLCIMSLIASFLVFRHVSFLAGLWTFAVLWLAAYQATKHDPQIVAILPRALVQKRVYDPAKVSTRVGTELLAPWVKSQLSGDSWSRRYAAVELDYTRPLVGLTPVNTTLQASLHASATEVNNVA